MVEADAMVEVQEVEVTRPPQAQVKEIMVEQRVLVLIGVLPAVEEQAQLARQVVEMQLLLENLAVLEELVFKIVLQEPLLFMLEEAEDVLNNQVVLLEQVVVEAVEMVLYTEMPRPLHLVQMVWEVVAEECLL